MLIYKLLRCLEIRYTRKKYTIATCVKQKMAMSDEEAAHRSAIQVSFSIRIDAYQHVLPIEINRMLQECFKSTCIYLVW